MKDFIDSISLEKACDRIRDLDILTNPLAQNVFCQVAIEYARNELRQSGIDLLTIAAWADLASFCKLWLSKHLPRDNEVALIGVSHAIQLNVKEILANTSGSLSSNP